MEVGNGFAGVRAVVHDEAEALREVELLRDLAGDEEEVAEDGLVGGGGFADAWYQLFGDDEQVDGGLRLDVVEDDAVFVLVLEARGDLAGDDFFEDRRHGAEGKRLM